MPLDQLIVVGSAVLEVIGLRQAGDIDMTGSPTILQQLENDTHWSKRFHADGSYVFLNEDFEIGNNWLAAGPKNNFYELLKRPDTFNKDGVYFVGLQTVFEWKTRMNRPKDQADIKLIDEYLQNHLNN